jgi:D-glycero-D-manno-heptose 1,7-bisphosphate phosphatase
MHAAGRPALFLDRDGTIIVDVGYIRDPADVKLLPGVGEALMRFGREGVALVVVSNQSGVGRGIVPPASVADVDEEMRRRLREFGVELDASYYCPHAPGDGCRCRKPRTGSIEDAAAALDLDLSRSAMVGDRASDVEAGLDAGCAAVFALGFDFDHPDVTRIESLMELEEYWDARATTR